MRDAGGVPLSNTDEQSDTEEQQALRETVAAGVRRPR
jgi:hypothetical protein